MSLHGRLVARWRQRPPCLGCWHSKLVFRIRIHGWTAMAAGRLCGGFNYRSYVRVFRDFGEQQWCRLGKHGRLLYETI